MVVIASTVFGHACDYLIAVLSKTDRELNTCIVHPNPTADLDPEYTGRYPHAYEAWTCVFFRFFFFLSFFLSFFLFSFLIFQTRYLQLGTVPERVVVCSLVKVKSVVVLQLLSPLPSKAYYISRID